MEQKIKKKITHCNASKEEVIKYYLDENHSLAQTSRFFNCKPDAMKGFLKRNNIFKESTNEDLMLKNGFVEIYDCGQSVYIWEVKNA